MKQGDSIFADFGEQGTFFGNEKYFSRRTDSVTSKRAVNQTKIEGELKLILEAIHNYPGEDFTARELANDSGIDYIVISKRLSVLQRNGKINKSGADEEKPLIRNGSAVWWLL